MKRSESPNLFELEMLEERILLSADSLLGGLLVAAPDTLDPPLDINPVLPPLEEVQLSEDPHSEHHSVYDSRPYDPSQKLDDIFSGLTEENTSGDGEGDSAKGATPYEEYGISGSQQDELTRGLLEFTRVEQVLDDFNEFSTVLPLTKDSSMGGPLSVSEILDTRLSKPVFDYFNDAVDPPSTDGVLGALKKIPGESNDLNIALSSVDGDFAPGDNEVRSDVKMTGTREGEVCLNGEAEMGEELFSEATATAGSLAAGLPPSKSDSPNDDGPIFYIYIQSADSQEPRDLTLRTYGEDLKVIDTFTGQQLASKPLKGISEVVIQGVDNQDDTLTLDFNGGVIEVPITFHGGAAGFDSLVIEGGSFTSSVYLATGSDSGTVTLDGTVIYYTGLEPITDTSTVADRTFNDTTSGNQQIRLVDDGDPSNGLITIDSNGTGGFESLTFPNPDNSLTINGGIGDDTILIDSLDNGFAAALFINGQDGNDTIVTASDLDLVLTDNGLTIGTRMIGLRDVETAVLIGTDEKTPNITGFSGSVVVTQGSGIQGVVTTTSDVVDDTDGSVSLREAIIRSNETPGIDTIILPPGTFTLSRSGANEDAGATGDLDILESVTILGAGAGRTVIDADGKDRVFHVLADFASDDSQVANPRVKISGVTITGGSADRGGGLYNQGGTVSLIDSPLRGNNAQIEGAAFFNDVSILDPDTGTAGLISLTNSPVSNNTIGGADDEGLFRELGALLETNGDAVLGGIDDFLATITDSLESAFTSVDLPVVGDQLAQGMQPVFDALATFRTDVHDFLQEILPLELSETAPSLPELFQDGLFLALGPGEAGLTSLSAAVQEALQPLMQQIPTFKLNLLQDGPDGGSDIGPSDITFTLGEDGIPSPADNRGTRWLEFDAHLGQRAVIDLPGFDLGLDSAAQFIGGTASADAANQLNAFLDTFGFSVNSSDGIRFDLRWDLRLGFGVSERPETGFYLNSGATTNGLPDGVSIEELRASVDAFAAPPNASEASTFGQQFRDVVTTPNLRADVSLGLLDAHITDGTPAAVQITAPTGLPLNVLSPQDFSGEFDIIIDDQDPVHISYASPQGGELLPQFLLGINLKLVEAFNNPFPPVSFTLDFSPIDRFFNPGAPTTPFLVLNARFPEINHLSIIGAEEYNFLATQYENRRVLGMGFGNNTFSTASADGKTQELVAELPAPAEGVSVEDPSFFVTIGGERVVGPDGIEYTEDGTPVFVFFREILNRDITTLKALRTKLEDILQGQIASTTPFPAGTVTIEIVDGDRFKLVSHADPVDPLAVAPLITVTYQAVDQTKLSLLAAVDITNPDFEESYLKDFPNDQRNFNWLPVSELREADDVTKFLVPSIAANAAIRLHVEADSESLAGFAEQQLGLVQGTIGLPSVGFDFKLDTSLDLKKVFEGGDVAEDVFSIKSLQFDNITLDVGELLETVVAPITQAAVAALEPVLEVIGRSADDAEALLNQPLPVISDIAGEDVTLRNILGETITGDIESFLEVIGQADGLGQVIASFVASDEFRTTLTDNGEFTLGGLELVMDPDSILYFPKTRIPVPIDLASLITGVEEIGIGQFLRSFTAFSKYQPAGFNVDLFNPQTVFNMLLGEPFNIVSFGLPTIDADAGAEFGFSFQDLSVDINAAASFDSNLRIVYDSAGIARIISALRAGATPDPADLLTGFAIQNNANGFELGGSVSFDGEGEIGPIMTGDIVAFRADAHIHIFAILGLEIHDPNNDGKLRLDELFDLTDDFAQPQNLFCLFDILGNGNVDVGGSAVGLGEDLGTAAIGLATGELSLQQLLESVLGTCLPDTTPILADEITMDGETVLRLNTGPFANARLHGDTHDDAPDAVMRIVESPDGSATIIDPAGDELVFGAPTSPGDAYVSPEGDDSTLVKTAGGIFQRTIPTGLVYQFNADNDIESIQNRPFLLKNVNGSLTLELAPPPAIAETRYLYDASSRLTSIEEYSLGTRVSTSHFFEGADVTVHTDEVTGDLLVSGYGVSDQRYSDSYSKIVATGSPFDDHFDLSGVSAIPVEVDGRAGNDVLFGGSGNDLLIGGEGGDEIQGNDGNDHIDAGTGMNTVTDGLGDDFVDVSANAIGVIFMTSGGNDTVLGTVFDDKIAASGTGNVRFEGGQGNDALMGGPGNDTLLGGEGDDELSGGAGNDLLQGDEDDDTLIGDAGADRLLGGQGTDTMIAGLEDSWVEGGSGIDHLLFKVDERPHAGTLTAGFYAVQGGTATPYFTVEDISVHLGDGTGVFGEAPGNYRLTIDGPTVPLTSVKGGTGHDTITVASLPDFAVAAAFDLGGGDDTLTVLDTQRALAVGGEANGPNGDRLIIDRSADPVPRGGEMTGTRIAGLGIADIDYDGFEFLKLNLGSGDDRFTINDTRNGTTTTVNAGSGADQVNVFAISDNTTVNGGTTGNDDSGDDTVTVVIPGDPNLLTETQFADLTFAVEKLHIDNTANATARADWKFLDGTIFVGAMPVLDTLGAKATIFDAGGALTDTLTVQDSVDVPQSVFVDAEHVRIDEGANVLSANSQTAFTGFKYGVNVDGLDGARDVAVSPDGKFVYTTGELDSAVTVFRREADGRLSFVQVLKDGELGVDGLNAAGDIVVSPDGQNVYVAGRLGFEVAIFRRVPETGRLIFRNALRVGNTQVTNLAISPDGANLYVIDIGSLRRFSRDPSTGLLTAAESISILENFTGIAVALDGTDLFTTSSSFSGSNSHLHQFHLGPGGALPLAPTSSVAGSFTDVAVGPNDTVYATFDGGVKYFISFPSGLTLVQTQYILPPENLTEATAVAVDPDGDRVVVGVDTTSVDPRPAIRKFELVSIWVINERDDDFVKNDDVAIVVNGDQVFQRNMAQGQIATDLSDFYSEEFTVNLNIQAIERSDLPGIPGGNDLVIGGTLQVASDLSPGVYSVDFVQTLPIFGTELTRYRLTYRVFDERPATPTITPIVTFARSSSTGALSSPLPVDISGVARIDSLAISPDSRDFYGTSFLSDLVTMYRGSFLGNVRDGDGQELSAIPQPGPDTVRTVVSPDGIQVYSISAKFGVITLSNRDPETDELVSDAAATVPAGLMPGASLAMSTDGMHLYVTNPGENSVSAYDRDTANGHLSLKQVFTDEVNAFGLAEARSVIVSPDGMHVYVAGFEDDAVALFSRNPTTDELTFWGRFERPELDGPSSLTLSGDGSYLYVTSALNDQLLVVDTNHVTTVQTLADGVDGVDGLANPVASTLSQDVNQSYLYVAAREDDAISVFTRNPVTGQLSFVQKVSGLHATDGVSALTVSADDRFVFAAADGDKLAVFARAPTDGRLTMVQRLRDGAAGVSGIVGATDMDISADGRFLYVSSEGPDVGAGGVAVLNIAQEVLPGKMYRIEYHGMEMLTVQSANGPDTVNAGEVAITFDLDTSGGADVVTLRNTGTGTQTSLRLGDDPDILDLLTTGTGSSTIVFGGVGDDEINVYGTAAGAVTTVDGDADNDTILVRGALLGSEVTVTGDVPNFNTLRLQSLQVISKLDLLDPDEPFIMINGQTVFSANTNSVDTGQTVSLLGVVPAMTIDHALQVEIFEGNTGFPDLGGRIGGTLSIPVVHQPGLFQRDFDFFFTKYRLTYEVIGGQPPDPGDTLVFDAHGFGTDPVNPQPSAGTVRIAGSANGVTYNTIENIGVIGSPQADAGGPYIIAEGDSLALIAAASFFPLGHTPESYEWSIGETFGIATGLNPTVPWTDLVEAGVGDDGAYQVSVRVTSRLGDETFSDIATAPFTIVNTPPTLTLSGEPTVESLLPYLLGLSSFDPGDDTIQSWHVDWGDGSQPEIYNGDDATVIHVYASPGDFTVEAIAFDEDGGPYGPATKPISVTDARQIGGEATIFEGSAYILSLSNPSGAAIDNWRVNWGDGTLQTVAGTLDEVAHTYADNGGFRIMASTTDAGLTSRRGIGPVAVRVLNVAPTISTVSASGPFDQGSPVRIAVDATDPGLNDILTYEFDFNDDGRFELASPSSVVQHVFRDVGTFPVSVRVSDDDGGVSDVESVEVTIENSGPEISEIQLLPADAREGTPQRVRVMATDPGHTQDPLRYGFDFDNDGIFEIETGANVAQHTFPDNGEFLVSVRVTDGHGASTGATFAIDVVNVAPSLIRATAAGRVEEGSPAMLTVIASDPARENDPLTYQFDFDNDGVFDASSGTGIVMHTFADDGTYDVPIRFSDDDGGVTDGVMTVLVHNVLPAMSIAGDAVVDEGAQYTLTLGVPSDPGPDTVSEFRVFWGDGSTFDGNAYESFAGPGEVTHIFLEGPAEPTVGVSVVDEEGIHFGDTLELTVTNVAPVITSLTNSAESTGGGVIGQPVTVAGTFSDVGVLDTHTATIDWGDGTVTDALISESDGSGTFSGEHAYEAGGTFTITVSLMDDDGGTDEETTTALLTGVAVVDRTLVIVGTESDDHVFVERLEPMPIAYWSLNETRGNTVADSAGTPQDGTFFAKGRPDLDDAGPPLAKAPFGAETGADFHGTKKEYIAVPHDPEFEVDEGTVMLWFNTDNPWGDQTLFSKDHRDSGQDGLLNIGLDDRRVVVRLQGEGESYSIRTDKVIKKHTWYHLAFSFGEEGMALYLDGVLVGENAFTGGMAANREPIVIGGSLKCNTKDSGDLSRLRVREPFDGRIDEVAFYGKALDGNQIKQSMLKGPESMGTSDEPLIAVHASFLPDPGQVRTFSAADIDNIEILLDGGDDRACVGDSVDLPVRIDGGSGDDYLKAGRGPSVLLGGEGDDKLIGGSGNDVLEGDSGNDLLIGSSGDDQISGGEGDDKLIGGGGDDVLEGGSGNDLLIGNTGDDLMSGGDGDDKLIGGSGGDVLKGEGGDDLLIGGSGNDELFGDSGNDKLIGGSGHDLLDGGSGDDTLIDWPSHYNYFKLIWYKGFHHKKDRHCVSWGKDYVGNFATYRMKLTPYGSSRSSR